MTLCSLCQSIPYHALPEVTRPLRDRVGSSRLKEINRFWALEVPDNCSPPDLYLGFPHQQSVTALKASAASCGLCGLIHDSVRRFLDAFADARSAEIDGDWNPEAELSVWLSRRFDGGAGFLAFTPTKLMKVVYTVAAVGLCVEEGSPLASSIRGRPVHDSGGDDETLNRAGRWLDHCLQSHSHCPSTTVAPLPARVLDLGCGAECDDVRLIETDSQQHGCYATLSHSWGTIGHFTTTRATLAARKQGIGLAELPKTFCDAVLIARRLSIRYLWIDSLCIIQDDRSDWSRESGKMPAVYANSHLTIAASAAKDNETGCFVPRSPLRRYVSVDLGDKKVLAFDLPLHKASINRAYLEMSDEPLSKRAWALQERVMSHRVLHCATDQMYYECNHHFLSEDGFVARGRLDSLYPGPEPSFRVMIPRDMGRSSTHTLWNCLLKQYMGRDLTVPEDRFPALAGLARLFAERLRATYIAGLWSDSIVSDLAWNGLDSGRLEAGDKDIKPASSSPYIAPSWSWAAYPGIVARVGAGYEDVATMLDYHVDIAGSDPFGMVSGGWIRLRGPLVPLSVVSDVSTQYISSRSVPMKTPWGCAVGGLLSCDSEDCKRHLRSARVFGLVLTQEFAPEWSSWYTVLALAAFEDGGDEMKRIGIMRMDDDELGNRMVVEDIENYATVTLV